ncbi:class I SAM-dependent methyltransferase [Paenibacillus elgii]|uniref:class I SAM-dependent methyltransferase n=1 Tax=Paenibacillus elgii TaxID=189691 RepID=UPI000FDC33DD|nr:class I SAM-dependent methyltransferase [Paenibacillus elgii]NEN81720.1 methyltransferase domain-containing protein [Paenibacillus elgii]
MEKVWNVVWKKDNYALEKVRNNKALKKFNIYESLGVNFHKYKKVGDFGAGGGYMTLELINRYPSIESVRLYDYSEDALLKSKENLANYSHVSFKQHDLNVPMTDHAEQHDFIMAFSVLEHIHNYETGLQTLFDHLESSGEAIMVWSHANSIFKWQRQWYEKLNLWNYGFQKEMTVKEIYQFLDGKFDVLCCKVVPCVGDKGVWTLLDNVIHKFNKQSGRYLFLHLKKKQ